MHGERYHGRGLSPLGVVVFTSKRREVHDLTVSSALLMYGVKTYWLFIFPNESSLSFAG